jgi:hypothetical protein
MNGVITRLPSTSSCHDVQLNAGTALPFNASLLFSVNVCCCYMVADPDDRVV